ncbi:hypothetical protein AB6A40_002511 [Gnathostoma spinigerum]|uniref:HAT C-terminal dimerisation domain-containing protein n=1 Tax=Gnathostoma spinigerum TaxID=75299 RepID=A0ABD6EGW8_9BILA
MSIATAVAEPPEAKKFRLSLPTQVVVQPPVFDSDRSTPVEEVSHENLNGGRSSVELSSAASPNSLIDEKNVREEGDLSVEDAKNFLTNGSNLVDVLSTAMMFQANALLMQQKQEQQQHQHSYHNQQQQQQRQQFPCHLENPSQKVHHHRSPRSSAPIGPVIPGAVAVANSPAAALFNEDDWSWHRNPAAAIRSGGTNKQTPVWKYFVYNKSENLSRCIVGDCTYMLKGPHTSTLACHLKKHPNEYAEFQKLKVRHSLSEYTRDRAAGQLTPSPTSSTTGSMTASSGNSSRTKLNNSYMIKTSRLADCSLAALSLRKSQTNGHPIKGQGHHVSSILNALNARASAAAVASGNAHLVWNPISALTATSGVPNLMNQTNEVTNIIKSSSFLADNLLTSGILGSSTSQTPGSSRKWAREERKQKAMEVKLALMLSATQLPFDIIENSFFREFLEFAQPKFNVPKDVNYLEEIADNQQVRSRSYLKNQLSATKCVSIMVDALKLPSASTSAAANAFATMMRCKTAESSDSGVDASSDEGRSVPSSPHYDRNRPDGTPFNIVRLCISAAYFSPLAQRMEVVLLGVRPVEDDFITLESVRRTVNQVLADYEISQDRVSRFITSGVNELLGKGASDLESDLFPRMLKPYSQKLTQCLLDVIDSSPEIDRLKKSFYEMISSFFAQPEALSFLQLETGRIPSLPVTDSFLVLVDALLDIKDAFLKAYARLSNDASLSGLSNEQWQMLEEISRLLRLFHTHMNFVQDGSYATIDGVVPSLMQLQLSLEKDFGTLGSLPAELKRDLQQKTASMLDMSAPNFDGSYIQATALNPHLALFLDDEQLAYAKSSIERMLNERMRADEEVVARRNLKLNGGVDALLAAVVDRRTATVVDCSSSNGSTDGSDLSASLSTSSLLYPDLIHAANQRRREMQEKQIIDGRNRYAEAIVQSYFDELASGVSQQMPINSVSLAGLLPCSLSGRQLRPLQFWQLNSVKCGHLAEIAIELLTVPSSTVTVGRIFSTAANSEDSRSNTSRCLPHGVGSLSFLKSVEDPRRLERDAMLRFNHNVFPRL